MGIRNLSIYAGSSFKIFGLGINVILDVLGDDAMCDIMSNQGIPNCVTPRVYKVRYMKYGSKDAYTLSVVSYFCPNIRITCQQYTSRPFEEDMIQLTNSTYITFQPHNYLWSHSPWLELKQK